MSFDAMFRRVLRKKIAKAKKAADVAKVKLPELARIGDCATVADKHRWLVRGAQHTTEERRRNLK